MTTAGPSRQNVEKMFDAISSTYDRVNRVMTLGIDAYWRKKLCQLVPKRKKLRILDGATGTGDQILALMKNCDDIKEIIGIDLAHEMLKIGRDKIKEQGFEEKVSLIEGSLQEIPFKAHFFDCATIAFGIRNVTDVALTLKEMHRILKPGGKLLILECSMPKNKVLKSGYLIYLRYLLPKIGGLISKNKQAYVYLNQTIESFPCGGAFCNLLKTAGFIKVKALPLTGGAVTIYSGDK